MYRLPGRRREFAVPEFLQVTVRPLPIVSGDMSAAQTLVRMAIYASRTMMQIVRIRLDKQERAEGSVGWLPIDLFGILRLAGTWIFILILEREGEVFLINRVFVSRC